MILIKRKLFIEIIAKIDHFSDVPNQVCYKITNQTLEVSLGCSQSRDSGYRDSGVSMVDNCYDVSGDNHCFACTVVYYKKPFADRKVPRMTKLISRTRWNPEDINLLLVQDM